VLVHEERSTIGAAASGMYDLQDAFFVPVAGFSTIARSGPNTFIYRARDSSLDKYQNPRQRNPLRAPPKRPKRIPVPR
jgi:hypothetical protein